MVGAGLVAFGCLLGGQADGPALRESVVLLLGLWTIIFALRSSILPRESQITRNLFRLIGAALLVIALSLLPLPYSLWTSLTGSQFAQSTLEAAGMAGTWRPLSMDWYATLGTVIYLMPPVAVLMLMIRLQDDDRKLVLGIVTAAALISIILGLMQVASGADTFYLYVTAHDENSTGVFANRNHQADLTLIFMVFACAWFRDYFDNHRVKSSKDRIPVETWLAIIAIAVALIMASLNLVAAASRTGLVMAAPVALVSLGLLAKVRRGGAVFFLAVLAGLAILFLLSTLRPDLFVDAYARFDADDDTRLQIWPTVVELVRQYFPLGSGLGSFVPVFANAQPLSTVNERFVNHAHNDYLEIALELGLPGIALMVLFFAWFAWAVYSYYSGRKDSGQPVSPFAVASITGIFVLLFHSAPDYSLRTTSLAVIFAVMIGYLLPVPRRMETLFLRLKAVRRANVRRKRKSLM